MIACNFSCFAQWVLIGVLLPSSGLVYGQAKKETSADTDQAKVVSPDLLAHLAAMANLKTGRFRATGVLTDSTFDKGVVSGRVNVICAFDFPNKRLRFDRTEPAWVSQDELAIAAGETGWARGTRGGQYARTAAGHVVHRLGTPSISLLKPSRQVPQWARPFDVRTVGLAHQHDLDWGVPFEKIAETYSRQLINSVAEESDAAQTSQGARLQRVEWLVYGKGARIPSFQRIVLFDPEKDSYPVKMELRELRSYRESKNSGGNVLPIWSELRESQAIEVAEFNGHWVPREIKFIASGGKRKEVLRFQWEMVNEALDPIVFSPEGFDLQGVERIVSLRSAKPIVLRDLRVDGDD